MEDKKIFLASLYFPEKEGILREKLKTRGTLMTIEKKYLNEKEVAQITGFALQTLRNFRHCRRGIPYSKIGRSVRYNLQEVIGFMEARRIETSDSVQA